MLKMMMMLLEVLWTRTLPPLDCWTASSRGGILYPRPHQPGEEVTLRRSCYRGQPSSPGGSLATLGAPIYQLHHCDCCKLKIVGLVRPVPQLASFLVMTLLMMMVVMIVRMTGMMMMRLSLSWSAVSRGKSSTLTLYCLSITNSCLSFLSSMLNHKVISSLENNT